MWQIHRNVLIYPSLHHFSHFGCMLPALFPLISVAGNLLVRNNPASKDVKNVFQFLLFFAHKQYFFYIYHFARQAVRWGPLIYMCFGFCATRGFWKSLVSALPDVCINSLPWLSWYGVKKYWLWPLAYFTLSNSKGLTSVNVPSWHVKWQASIICCKLCS